MTREGGEGRGDLYGYTPYACPSFLRVIFERPRNDVFEDRSFVREPPVKEHVMPDEVHTGADVREKNETDRLGAESVETPNLPRP